MCGNSIGMMVIRRPLLPRIAQKLQYHAFIDLELHPAKNRDMRGKCHYYDYRDNNSRFHDQGLGLV